jgi:hypothetical protein
MPHSQVRYPLGQSAVLERLPLSKMSNGVQSLFHYDRRPPAAKEGINEIKGFLLIR